MYRIVPATLLRVIVTCGMVSTSAGGNVGAALVEGEWPVTIEWQTAVAPALTLVGAAYDERRDKLVIVGFAGSGDHVETWERSDGRWIRASVAGPSPREEPLVAFDRARSVVVLYGGNRLEAGPALTDTWEWDGATWTQRAATGPALPMGGALAFDSKHHRLVLFDGDRANADTKSSGLWSWDGAAWAPLPLVGTAVPPRRGLFAFAYDEARTRFVLFGGFFMQDGRPQQLGDTWEWDGEWRDVRVAGPTARDHAAMVYDARRRAVVLHGGGTPATGVGGDTWQFDGVHWMQIASDGPRRGRHRLIFDAKRQLVQLYGGWKPERQQSSELWELRGNAWALDASGTSQAPPAAYSVGAAFDSARARLVVFGGFAAGRYVGDTWEWDSAAWSRSAQPGPSARNGPAMVYEAARGRLLLFGGDARPVGDFSDTWERIGENWRRLDIAGPPARSNHGMVYDARRDRVVLFGGFAAGVALGDTWEFDGMRWTQVAASGPPARGLFAMAYDARRSRTVVFGGNASPLPDSPPLGDTWEWDGQRWTRVNVTGPSARDHTQMAYDDSRRLIVLHGGGDDADAVETWTYDGHAWTREAGRGPARRSARMVFDTRRNAVLLYGGFAAQPTNEIWQRDGSGWTRVSP